MGEDCSAPVTLPIIENGMIPDTNYINEVRRPAAAIHIVTDETLKVRWFLESMESGARQVMPLDMKDEFEHVVVREGDGYMSSIMARSVPVPDIWRNLLVYIIIENSCHNIHISIKMAAVVEDLKNGPVPLPTLKQIPKKHYSVTYGENFEMTLLTSGQKENLIDLAQRSPDEQERYVFFEKAFWNDGEIGVRYRTGKPWLNWTSQYPNKRPKNVRFVQKLQLDTDDDVFIAHTIMFNPVSDKDAGIYETKFKLGLNDSIEIRMYTEIAELPQFTQLNYPTVAFLPCNLYPVESDAKARKIIPSENKLDFGLEEESKFIDNGMCFMMLAANRKRAILGVKDQHGKQIYIVHQAVLPFGTIKAYFYLISPPSTGERKILYYDEFMNDITLTFECYTAVRVSLKPKHIALDNAEGRDVTMRCRAKGYPRPVVMFIRKDATGRLQPMIGGRYETRLRIISTNAVRMTLKISNFTLRDVIPFATSSDVNGSQTLDDAPEGVYCIGKNQYSTDFATVDLKTDSEDNDTLWKMP